MPHVRHAPGRSRMLGRKAQIHYPFTHQPKRGTGRSRVPSGAGENVGAENACAGEISSSTPAFHGFVGFRPHGKKGAEPPGELLPALLGLVSEVFASVRHDMEFRDDGFHFFSEGAEGYAAAPEPEPKPEPGYETGEVLLSGAYLSEDTGLSLTIDNDALTYQLILDDFEQSGDFYLEYNDPDTSMDYYTEEFPPEEYSSYLLALWHTEDWDEDAVSCTLVNVYVALDEPGFYLDNTFADAPWLPLDRAIVMERQDIG